MIKLYTNKLGLENDRLRRENEYLRKLLSLDPHTPLVMPEEKPADIVEKVPIENTENIDTNLSSLYLSKEWESKKAIYLLTNHPYPFLPFLIASF